MIPGARRTAGSSLLAALAALALGLPAPPRSAAQAAPADGPVEGGADATLGFSPRELAGILDLSPLPPPPPDPTNRVADDPRAARLGQFVFYDPRFSDAGDTSCSTCHLPEKSFTDGRQLARGRRDLARHAPTLWNAAYNRWNFWDGRTDSLWAQATDPIESPEEMGFSRRRVLAAFHDDPELAAAYAAIFGPLPPRPDEATLARDREAAARFEPPPGIVGSLTVAGDPGRPAGGDAAGPGDAAGFTPVGREPAPPPVAAPPDPVDVFYANVAKCLAAFERRIVSRHAPFDTFVEGLRDGDPAKLAALPEPARRGLALFVGRARCDFCHSGPEFTDREFHSTRIPPLRDELRRDPGRRDGVVAVLADPFNGKGPFSDDPAGEAVADKLDYIVQAIDLYGTFKTPTLRNVARTAPYMHQGQVATLRDVLRHYSTFEDVFDPLANHFEQTLQPLHLTEQETDDLLAFLESLTDEGLDPALLARPDSPR